MRFKIQFIVFISAISILFIAIWSSIPKVNFKITYDERVGNPINGITFSNLWLTTEEDTIHCDQVHLLITSLNPFTFKIEISECYIQIRFRNRGGRSLWFIPFRISGKIRLNDGKLRIGDQVVKDINANARVEAFGPIIEFDLNNLFCEYQRKQLFASGHVSLTPGMLEIMNGEVFTEGTKISLNGSLLSDRAKFDIDGSIDLRYLLGVSGEVIFKGKVLYEEGIFNSDLAGEVTDLFNIESTPLLINISRDTIRAIFPRIESDPGFASAQVLFVGTVLKRIDLDFENFQMSKYFPQINLPVDGHLSLNKGRWQGQLSSQSTGFDSIIVSGETTCLDIRGFNQDGFCEIKGNRDSLLVGFARFPIVCLGQILNFKGQGMLTGVIRKDGSNLSGEFELSRVKVGILKSDLLKCVIPSLQIPKMKGSAKINGYGLEIAGVEIGEFAGSYDNGHLTLTSGDSITLKANRSDRSLIITHLNARTRRLLLTSLNPFSIKLDHGFKIDDLNLYANDGLVKGSITISHEPSFDLKVVGLDIHKIDPLFKGKFSLEGKGRRIDFAVDNLQFQNHKFGRLTGGLIFKTDRVETEGSIENLSFAGSIYPEPKVRFRLDGLPLSHFWFLNDYLQVDDCRLKGEVILSKASEGNIIVSGPTLLVRATRSLIRDLTGRITIKGNRVIFTTLKGKTDQGDVSAKGWLDIKRFQLDTLHLNIVYDRGYISLPNINGYSNGQFSIDAGKRLLVNGTVDVIEGIYSYSLAEMEGFAKRIDDKLDLDLMITAPKGIMLRGDLVNSYLDGELRLQKKKGIYSISGEFISNRGDIHYLDHTMRLEYANITFINDPDINPLIDLRASMPTRTAYRIIFRVTGRLREPIFTFSSDPEGLSEQDIITYLNTGFTWTELQEMGSEDKISSLASERLIRLMTYSLSKELKGISGLDYLEIEKSQLSIGKYLKPNIFFSYTHRLGDFSDDAFELDYTIRPRERIVFEKLKEGEYSLQYKLRIKF